MLYCGIFPKNCKLLGSRVVPFCPFCFRVPLLKLNISNTGTLTMKALLRNLTYNTSLQIRQPGPKGAKSLNPNAAAVNSSFFF